VSDDLLRRLRGGEASAARELDERYRAALMRYAFRLLGDASAAEDVVQETFARAFSAGEMPQRTKPWLYQAVRNACSNRRRDAARRGDLHLPSDAPLAASQTGHLTRLVRAEEREALRSILAEMPAAQREVLDLRYGEDLTREEIAEVLGIEPSVVKSRLYEGMQRLRSRAGHLGQGPRSEG
jgi:RNA polymerase sigma-70 factor (ECF subfamily)